jgi:hypothetical protein
MNNQTEVYPKIEVAFENFNKNNEGIALSISNVPEDRIVHLISELFDTIPSVEYQSACIEILLGKMGHA